MQLTTGRMGKLEIVGKAEAGSDSVIRTNMPLEKYDNNDSNKLNVEEEDVEDVDDEEI